MVSFLKIVGVLIIFALLIYWLGNYVWIIFAVVGVIILIRLIADIFWKGKDKNWW